MSELTRLSDRDFDTQITLREAFHVLVAFLEQYNARGPRETDILQSDLTLEANGSTSDPAQLDDFLGSAKSVVELRRGT
jgi:hypothetical protein